MKAKKAEWLILVQLLQWLLLLFIEQLLCSRSYARGCTYFVVPSKVDIITLMLYWQREID